MAQPTQDVVTLVVAVLLESLFIHFAATFLVHQPRFSSAFAVAILGSLLAFLMFLVVGAVPVLALILALICWLGVCATIYRTSWLRALLIGLLAYLLWVAVRFLILSAFGGRPSF